jgi:hypothetical protein
VTRHLSARDFGALLLLACSDAGPPANSGNLEEEPGEGVDVQLPPGAIDGLAQTLAIDAQDDADSLARRYAVPFSSELGYDPLAAPGLSKIIDSMLGDSMARANGVATLGRTGFVIGTSRTAPSFPLGYSWIYAEHLPVFISADMVLEAVHRSYDDILTAIEQEVLEPRLRRMLAGMADRLGRGMLLDEPEVAGDIHFFLSVARALLGAVAKDAFGPEVEAFVDAALVAGGEQEVLLFGTRRLIDFSQFTPRGHYTQDETLKRYFRAMIWLGRTDLRLIETLPDGSRTFRRRQVEIAYGLRALLDEQSFADFRAIDTAIGAFVGEHDDMTLTELDALSADLGIQGRAELARLDDATIAQAIVAGNYGEQRIASQIMRRSGGGPSTLPLSASFALLGQRYTPDSHVLSNVVFDRVPDRVVPDPLDVAFAALHNDQAVSLLAGELAGHDYAGALSQVRSLVDAHPADHWQGSLYTSWLSALRALSPSAQAFAATPELPSVARSEAWGRRLLNTQLASWAELRRDSVLYVKQSYTSSVLCEFPDAYVDPYPDFFYGVAAFAERGQALVDELDWGDHSTGAKVAAYFASLGRITRLLGDMAGQELSGTPFDEEQMAFVNQAINVQQGCGGVVGHSGWYSELFFDPMQAVELDPTIADVHTDIGGDLPVSRPPSVLHVGTGLPRPIVLTVDSCNGPRAYAGYVFAYHQLLADGLDRMTDERWEERLLRGTPVPEPEWLAPLLE